jgi:hypothetical protein
MTAYNFTLITSIPHWSAGDLQAITAYYDLAGVALAQNDTITATGIIPGDGVKIYDIYCTHTELDSNTTPTGTYQVGDSGSAARFLSSVPMGVNGVTTSGFQLVNRSNFAPTTTNGVVATGLGYIYTGTTASNLILTVNGAVATGATTGVIFLTVLYRCVGNS